MNKTPSATQTNKNPLKPSDPVNLTIKILCVVAAFFLWIYVMLVESPEHSETFSHITVELTNRDVLEEKHLAVYNGYGTMIDVTLSGKKSVLSKLEAKDILATVDLATIPSSGGRTSCEISVDVPAGCRLVSMSQNTISVYVDASATIDVPLTAERDNISLPTGYFLGAINLPLDNVRVTGPAQYLDQVAKAVLPLDFTGVMGSTSLTEQIELYDAYGVRVENQYIKCEPEVLTIDIPVLKSVEVPIAVAFRYGYLNEDNTTMTLSLERVTATGDPRVIERGNLLETIVIDEKLDFTNDGFCIKTVALEAPNGVMLSSDTVDVRIQMDDSFREREIIIPGENIRDTGAKDGVIYSWDKTPVEIVLMGDREAIRSLQPEDITLQLDMSPYSATNTGTIQVRAEVIIDSPYRDEIFEIGKYDINVTFLN